MNKDLENIAKKVAAGKTLTSSEREHFMQQQPEVKDDNKITTKTTKESRQRRSRTMKRTMKRMKRMATNTSSLLQQ